MYYEETKRWWGKRLIMKFGGAEFLVGLSSLSHSDVRFCISVEFLYFFLRRRGGVSLLLLSLYLAIFLYSFCHPILAGSETGINFVLCRTSSCGRTKHAIVIKCCSSRNLISHVLIETPSRTVKLAAHMYYVLYWFFALNLNPTSQKPPS
jgi:hypothetical protein